MIPIKLPIPINEYFTISDTGLSFDGDNSGLAIEVAVGLAIEVAVGLAIKVAIGLAVGITGGFEVTVVGVAVRLTGGFEVTVVGVAVRLTGWFEVTDSSGGICRSIINDTKLFI
jgi:hypothetical protein